MKIIIFSLILSLIGCSSNKSYTAEQMNCFAQLGSHEKCEQVSKTIDTMHCMHENNHCDLNVDTSNQEAVLAAIDCVKIAESRCQ